MRVGGAIQESIIDRDRSQNEGNESQNDGAIFPAMQVAFKLLGADDKAPDREDDDSEKYQERKGVDEGVEDCIAPQHWDSSVEGSEPEVQGAQRNDNESPEGEEVGDAGDGIAQDAALAQHHGRKVADALPHMIEAIFRAAQPHHSDEPTDLQPKDDKGRHHDDGEDNCPGQSASGREVHTGSPLYQAPNAVIGNMRMSAPYIRPCFVCAIPERCLPPGLQRTMRREPGARRTPLLPNIRSF